MFCWSRPVGGHVICGEGLSRTKQTIMVSVHKANSAMVSCWSHVFTDFTLLRQAQQWTSPGFSADLGPFCWLVLIQRRPGCFCWVVLPLLICVWWQFEARLLTDWKQRLESLQRTPSKRSTPLVLYHLFSPTFGWWARKGALKCLRALIKVCFGKSKPTY